MIGHLATSRIRDDFNREVRSAAQTLAAESHIFSTPLATSFSGPKLDDFVRPDGASARVFSVEGSLLHLLHESAHAQPLGSPVDGLSDFGQMRVATARITNDSGTTTGFVQYGRSEAHVDSTIDRLWLFIAAGILGGTLLASLAGLAIAGARDAPDLGPDRDRARRSPTPAIPPATCPTRRPTTRSASWRAPWSRCCARSTPPAPSARRR